MKLSTPVAIQTLQRKLYLKAKQEPTFRFYSLYDKICRADVLLYAYRLVKANKGAEGVDGRTFEDVEVYGRERFLTELREELLTGRYHPEAVRRVMISKANGGQRPLGIPTIRDRVAQTAATPGGWCWSRYLKRTSPTTPTAIAPDAEQSRR